MTDKKQPEALRLAAERERNLHSIRVSNEIINKKNAENTALQAGYAAARLEIESLRARSAEPAGEYPLLPEPVGKVEVSTTLENSGLRRHQTFPAYTSDQMRAYVDADRAMRAAQHAGAQHGVGNSGFDHSTAADFLNGKNVSDEAVRKFVSASRWAHDDRSSLRAQLLSMRGDLASREAEIALLKKALMDAEQAPAQPDNSAVHLSHCNMGEHVGSCKYGDDDCPALRKAPAQAAHAAPPVPSGWGFDVKHSDGRVWLTISTPHGASATLSAAEKTGNGDDTIIAQVMDFLADSLAAPAAVAGPSDVVSIQRQAFIRGWDERGMAHQLKGTVETDERMRALMDIYFPRTAAPTTQPAPQQGAQEPVDEFQPCPSCFGTGVEGDSDDYGRAIDVTCGDCNGSGRSKATPQHSPQEVHGAFTKALSIRVAQGWKLGGDKVPVLYTDEINGQQVCRDDVWLCTTAALESQPSPASQGDALDAARYRYLRDVPMGLWPAELLSVIRLQQNAKWDAAIDAAREAQEDGQ